MAHFVRSSRSPTVKGGYNAFRPYVRADFIRQCAYCLLSEELAGGEENFELDHFRPKSRFPALLNDFFNIYYSCHPCNHTKLAYWPSAELEARGVSFVDLCKDNFNKHFTVGRDGEWKGRTNSGNYTIELLRLNRKHLVTIRQLLAKAGLAPHAQRVGESELQLMLKRKR